MRVTWVHPSWRDLVISELARDAALRRRFLHHCGVDGAALALSSGGGSDGDRVRPLLTEDADWDALGDNLHHACSELGPNDAVRLLAVLGEALDGVEADALSAMVLERLERRWRGHAVSVDALEAWTAAAGKLPPSATVAASWLELDPPGAPRTPVELERFADWLRLAELISVYDRELLDSLGFPDRSGDVLDAFIAEPALTEPPVERELRVDALARIARLDPTRADDALELVPVLDRSSAIVKQFELPELGSSAAGGFAVDRVLSDLLD
jgi:hypothetical protein